MSFNAASRIFGCLFMLLFAMRKCCDAQQQNPMTMNGGSLMAMAGNECVALAVDKRFGSGPQMINIAPRHVWAPHSNLMLAFSGLEGDVQSLSEELKIYVDSKQNRALGFSIAGLKTASEEDYDDNKQISPPALASLTSHILYEKRGYYVEPLVVGLTGKTRKPFLCAMDMLGAQSFSKSFVCSGAASTSLYGTAEALWQPNMEPMELLECCGKVFQSGKCIDLHMSEFFCEDFGTTSNFTPFLLR